MSSYKTLFIVNPASQSGELGKAWAGLAKSLRGKIRQFDFLITKKQGDATTITRKALKDGYEMIVSVGGDGTLSECVNGFFERNKPINPKAILGVLPFGRGSDFARGIGISSDPEKSIERLRTNKTKAIDVGFVTYHDWNKKKKTRYFLNIANVGLVSNVVNWSTKSPKFLGKKGAYVYGAIRGALEYRSKQVIYTSDMKTNEDKIFNIIVANGIYFGAGMKAAPRAKVDDGKFDIVKIGTLKPNRYIGGMIKIYSGDHLKMEENDFFRSASLEVEQKYSDDSPLYVEADGDTIGHLPAKFEILPQAILFKI